jgi:hypothetical protein
MCLLPVFESCVNNISRRDNSQIFGDCNMSYDNLMNKFKEARNKFIELGFYKKDIKCGYSLLESS